MATSTMVHVRVDEKVKKEAAKTLESMGLSVSDAVRVFLMRVVADKSLPFAVKAPNAASKAAMAEAESILKAQQIRFKNAGGLIEDLEKKRRKQTRKTSSRI